MLVMIGIAVELDSMVVVTVVLGGSVAGVEVLLIVVGVVVGVVLGYF